MLSIEEAVERLYRAFKLKQALRGRGPSVPSSEEDAWVASGDSMSTLDRLLRPNPPWLGGVILGDMTRGLDDDELPENCR